MKVFKKILLNIWKNLTKILLLSIIILLVKAWAVLHPLQIFRVFFGGGRGDVPTVPLATPLHGAIHEVNIPVPVGVVQWTMRLIRNGSKDFVFKIDTYGKAKAQNSIKIGQNGKLNNNSSEN